MTERRTHLLRPDDPAWERWRARAPHDFHHGAAYHAMAETAGEGTAWLGVHGTPERFMAWPWLVRPFGEAHVDGCSVYGYGGPFGLGLDDEAFVAGAWRAFREIWAEQRLVTLFTRFHPLLENHAICTALHGADEPRGGELLTIGRSVSIDLAASREARHRSYPKNLRQEIRAAGRAGLLVEEDVAWSRYAEFATLYRATMARNTASARYLFSDRYFADLRAALGEEAHLAVARVGEEAAAILLFTVCGDIAQAHLTGVDAAWRRLSPLKALIDGVAELARAHGATRLHLGAGRGGHEDALFDFKARFSPLRHDFVLGRWILDRDAHAALSPDGAPLGATGGAGQDDGAFFPAYRAVPPETRVGAVPERCA